MSPGYYDIATLDNAISATMALNSVENILRWLTHWNTLDDLRQRGVMSVSDNMVVLEMAIAACRFSRLESDMFHARFKRGLSVGETAGLLDVSYQVVSRYTRSIASKIMVEIGGDS